MAATLFTSSKYSATDAAGLPLAGGLVYTYAAGSLTPQATYTSQSGASPNTNPVVLDASGRASIWLGPYAYRFIVKSSTGALMPDGDTDSITSPTSTIQLTLPTTDLMTGDGTTTVYTLSANPATVNNVFFSLGGAIQVPGVDYTLSGVVITCTSPPPSGVAGFFNYTVALPVGATDASMVAAQYSSGGSAALNLGSYVEDDGSYNVMGFIAQGLKSAIRDRSSTVDVSAQIMTAQAAVLSARGGGSIKMPAGRWNIGTQIQGINNVGILGEGSGATLIYVTGTNNGITYGDGTTQFMTTAIKGLSILGTATSGIGFWGRIFTDSCKLEDVYVKGGTVGVKLDNCYSLGLEYVRVRSALGNGIECNSLGGPSAGTHNASLRRCKVQVNGGHGLYTSGCLTLVVRDSNFEFNAFDQINVASGRGITISETYIEGITNRASGYAGINVVAADTVNLIGGFFDATQVIASPADDFGRVLAARDGTGTYVKVSGASTRVKFQDYGFASIASTQTHINIGATAFNCTSVVPLGSTYTNSSLSSRIYHDDHDERGINVSNTAVQAYTFGVWNGLVIDTKTADPKNEWTSNQFTPRDHGTYLWTVIAGAAALAAGKGVSLRLFNITDSLEMRKVQFQNTGAGVTTQIQQVVFNELLSPLKTYQVQLYLDDTANRNSAAGSATACQTIKRIK